MDDAEKLDFPNATLHAEHIHWQLDRFARQRPNPEALREYLIMHLIVAEKRGVKVFVQSKFGNYGCD